MISIPITTDIVLDEPTRVILERIAIAQERQARHLKRLANHFAGIDLVITGGTVHFAHIKPIGGDDMNLNFLLPNNQPDESFVIAPLGNVTDAEGETVTGFIEEFKSTDPSVINVIFDDPNDIRSPARLAFGHSGTATVNHTLTKGTQVVPVNIFNFTLTTGEIVNVPGGGVTFTNITPVP